MGVSCSCCNQDKGSEVSVVIQPTAFETNIKDEFLFSYLDSDSCSDPLPLLSLPPISDPASFRSQGTQKAELSQNR